MKADELGRRAVACPRWRWMPGMLSRRHTSQGFDICRRHSEADCRPAPPADEYPDLTDPATLGCLLALVREAHGDADIVAFVVHSNGSPERWCVDVGPDPDLYDERKYVYRPTEVEALVAALEVAP